MPNYDPTIDNSPIIRTVGTDGSGQPAFAGSTSATVTSGAPVQVASSTTNVANLVTANASRKEVWIFNDSTSVLYLKYGSVASATSYSVQLAAGDILIEDRYTGRIDGVWATANGFAYVTEVA